MAEEKPDKYLFQKQHFYDRPSSYSEKESQSNDNFLHFIEFSNVHNSEKLPTPLDRASRIKMHENNARSRLFCMNS